MDQTSLPPSSMRDSKNIDDAVAFDRPTVLLAEDNPEMRELVAEMLRHEGYEVYEAWDGAELVDQLIRFADAGRKPNLIITDNRMPWTNGLSVIQSFRKQNVQTPIILMTAFSDAQTRTAACDLGASFVLDKPFALDDLRFMARHLVNRSFC